MLKISSKNAILPLTFSINLFLAYSSETSQSSKTRSFVHGLSFPNTSSFSAIVAVVLCAAQDTISKDVGETAEPNFASCFRSFAKVCFFNDGRLFNGSLSDPQISVCVSE